MIPRTLTTVALLLVFFVPGYLIASLTQYFADKKPESRRFREIFRILGYGLINFLVCMGLAAGLNQVWTIDERDSSVHEAADKGVVHEFWHRTVPSSRIPDESESDPHHAGGASGEHNHDGHGGEASTSRGMHHEYLVGTLLHWPSYLLFYAAYLFLGPFIIGGSVALWYEYQMADRIGRWVGLPPGRPTQKNAWEYALDTCEIPVDVEVVLQDGTVIGGRFDGDSHQTSEGLYLGEVIERDGRAIADPYSTWIDPDEILELRILE